MENEFIYLYLALMVAFLLAPVLTNAHLLNASRLYRVAHIISLLTVMIAIASGWGLLTIVWLLFCCLGLAIKVRADLKRLFHLQTLATMIPFVFSIIASIWLVAGSNNLFLLGYDKKWSFYAALHGNYLGWIFVGCLAILAKESLRSRTVYAAGCFLCFVLFLMVALGINGAPYLKPVGVTGLTLVIPFFICMFLFNATRARAKVFASISLMGIIVSMTLAVLNEFWTISPQFLFNARTMVSVHGMINALIVAPLFYFAVATEVEN